MALIPDYTPNGDKKIDKIIISVLKDLSLKEQKLVNKSLKYQRENDGQLFFGVDNIKQLAYVGNGDTKYWYRCMTKEHFLHLLTKDSMDFSGETDYGGLACNYNYSAGTTYFGNNKPGRYIVEYEFPTTLNEFLKEAGSVLKVEDLEKRGKGEGGKAWSIGFGKAGNCSEVKDYFNKELESRGVIWRLVTCRYPKP